jgi:uncharacterized protein
MAEEKNSPPKVSTTSPREVLRRLAGAGGPPGRTAVAFGLGVFVGFLPVMPFQTGLALALAFLFGLNRPAAFLGTLVWQPFTAPLILAAEWGVGRLFMAQPAPAERAAFTWGTLLPLLPGILPVAAAAGALAAVIAYWPLKVRSRQKEAQSVMERGRG